MGPDLPSSACREIAVWSGFDLSDFFLLAEAVVLLVLQRRSRQPRGRFLHRTQTHRGSLLVLDTILWPHTWLAALGKKRLARQKDRPMGHWFRAQDRSRRFSNHSSRSQEDCKAWYHGALSVLSANTTNHEAVGTWSICNVGHIELALSGLACWDQLPFSLLPSKHLGSL